MAPTRLVGSVFGVVLADIERQLRDASRAGPRGRGGAESVAMLVDSVGWPRMPGNRWAGQLDAASPGRRSAGEIVKQRVRVRPAGSQPQGQIHVPVSGVWHGAVVHRCPG